MSYDIGYSSSNMNLNITLKRPCLNNQNWNWFPFWEDTFHTFQALLTFQGTQRSHHNMEIEKSWGWWYHKSSKLTRGRKRAIAKGKCIIFHYVTILLKLLNLINFCHWLMLLYVCHQTLDVFIWFLVVNEWGFTITKVKYAAQKILVTFTEEILNRKLHFLCSGIELYMVILSTVFMMK